MIANKQEKENQNTNQKIFVFFVRNGGFFGHLCYNVVNRE